MSSSWNRWPEELQLVFLVSFVFKLLCQGGSTCFQEGSKGEEKKREMGSIKSFLEATSQSLQAKFHKKAGGRNWLQKTALKVSMGLVSFYIFISQSINTNSFLHSTVSDKKNKNKEFP